MLLFKDGHWYRSRQALERIKGLTLIAPPHVTPDGYAALVLDLRGVVSQPRADGPPRIERHPPAFVLQADHGHDVEHVATVAAQPQIRRVEFAAGPVSDVERAVNPTLLDPLSDLEPLEEYDHLPEARKDYSVFPRGHKLA